MESYVGISGKVLDSLTIFLRYKTAKKLGMCGAAADYWTSKFERKDLLITPDLIRKFRQQPDHKIGNVDGKIDVEGFVDLVLYRFCWFQIDINYNGTSKELSRILKACLLYKFKPLVYRQLGGC
jgi:hypothetical protein